MNTANPNRAPRRRSADEWRRLLSEQQESGLNQRDFCQQRALALSSFQNWKRRLADTAPVAKTEEAWLELPADLTQSNRTNWDIELDLGNGLCLRLRQR